MSDLWSIPFFLISYYFMAWLTAENLLARGNGPLVIWFGAMHWPGVLILVALRAMYRFLDSSARKDKGLEPLP